MLCFRRWRRGERRVLLRVVRRLSVVAAVCVGASAAAMYWLPSGLSQGGILQDYTSHVLLVQTIESTSVVPSIAAGVSAVLLAWQDHRLRWVWLLTLSVLVV